jgi:adenosine deaminase
MIDKTLPLVDLHRHLDGNIQPELVWKLADKNGIKLPGEDLSEFTKHAQIQGQTSDLLAFLEKLDYGVSVLKDYDDIYAVAYDNVRDAKIQHLDYAELRFSPYYMAMNHNLNMSEVVNVVADAVAAGQKDFDVQINLIGILSRTFGVEKCQAELDAILAHKEKICALDLAGDELNFPAEWFESHFKQARDAGLAVTVHAGEAAGAESVWKSIELLGATRIGHCIAALSDPELMEYMVKHDIAVESCPTSNFQTATVKSLESHPLQAFIDSGVIVCLNTDDPAVSNITLEHEFNVAKEVLNISDSNLKQLQVNGVKAAFLSDSEKASLIERVKAN